MYKNIIRPILFSLSAETTHELALFNLGLMSKTPIRKLIAKHLRVKSPLLKQELLGNTFENPIGLTAGMDKQGKAIPAWESLGFGYMEVGSITAKPQPGNPKKRMWRLPEDKSIIVYLGLPSLGSEKMAERIKKVRSKWHGPMVLGISLAKTKVTPSENAAEDYVEGFKNLSPYADFIVINLSCPNVAGFTDLQSPSVISSILKALGDINKGNDRKPVLIKIGPDFNAKELNDIMDVLLEHSVDGIIATNLRKKTRPPLKTKDNDYPGGLSGMPVQKLSDKTIEHLARRIKQAGKAETMKIIGVGGVFNAEDAYRKIRLGASLISLATGFIYGGPTTIKSLNKGLIKLLKRDGYSNISEAIGADL
jgi:dihydroorotate dehydrogenase